MLAAPLIHNDSRGLATTRVGTAALDRPAERSSGVAHNSIIDTRNSKSLIDPARQNSPIHYQQMPRHKARRVGRQKHRRAR